MTRKSALFRSRANVPVANPQEHSEDVAEHPIEEGEAPEEDFSDLPLPVQPEPEEGSGRVLGGGSRAPKKDHGLPAYEETIVIGKQPEPPPPPPPPPGEAPPPPPQGMDGQPMDETMAEVPQAPAAPPPPQIDKEIIERAQAEADQMLQQAQMQAQQMVQEAMAQASQQAAMAHEEARNQGYQEGLNMGLEEGRQAGQVELQEMLHAVKVQFIEFARMRRKVMADMEPEIVRLAWEVAKRVVGEEIKTNKEIILGIVRQSLLTLQERDEILIRTNPQDYESVKAHQKEFEAMIEGLKKFIVQPDGAVEVGSCVIETNLGNVDARIETQFEAIKLGLEEMSKIRQFESQEQLNNTPVEVPGDPEFESRMNAPPEEAPVEDAHGHGEEHHHEGHPEEHHQEQEMHQEQMEQYPNPDELELLPEPTEELLATLTPEEQQQYLEAYQQQQAYLEHLQAQMMAEQEGGG